MQEQHAREEQSLIGMYGGREARGWAQVCITPVKAYVGSHYAPLQKHSETA